MRRIHLLIEKAPAIDRRIVERPPAMLDGNGWMKLRRSAVLLALAVSVGCGGGVSPTGGDADFQTRRQLSTVATFYGDYLAENGGPPKDEAAFRAFLETRATQINRMNLGGVDGLLTSPRDGQSLMIVYGKRLAPADSPNTPWAAYEQTGVDGKQMAAQVRGNIDELSADAIQKEFATVTKK